MATSDRGAEPAPPPAAGKTKNPVARYALRFWHGMRLSTWWRELALNRFEVSPGRWALRSVGITVLSVFNSLLAILDRLIHSSRIEWAGAPASPIFILGHWRSGTTYLHELLTCDPAHSYPTTYRCFAPHHFLLSESLLKPWLGFFLPKRRPMDDMQVGWDRPMEDEFALANLGVPTPYLSMMFPNRGPKYPEYLTLSALDAAALRTWKREFLRFLKRLMLADDRRLVLKSPTHTARVRTLIEMFPGAKFVHIARDPGELYTSTLDMWRSLHREQGMQEVRDDDWLGASVIDSMKRMYVAYLEDRKLLGPGQLVEVRYDQLAADPKSQVGAIYDHLGLGDFARAEPALDAYLATVREYRPNRLPVEASVRVLVGREWTDYARAFGYD